MSELLSVDCPYCSNSFSVDPPLLGGLYCARFPEVMSLPYARDIGRFDPRIDEDQGLWSRIGEDFFSDVLGYERIGILRWKPGLNIFYRVGRCPSCLHMFDVYVNYTSNRTLDTIWPHLLSRGEGGNIRINSGLMPAQKFLLERPSILLFGLISLFFVSFLPRALNSLEDVSSFLYKNQAAIVTRLLGLATSFVAILLVYRMITIIRTDRRFDDLFRLKDNNMLTYWRNYTVCRFVGVQQSFLHPNQVTILSGYPSVLALVVIWLSSLCDDSHRWGSLVWLEVSLFILTGFFIGGILGSVSRSMISTGKIPGIVRVFRGFFPIQVHAVVSSIVFLFLWFLVNGIPVIYMRDFWINVDEAFALCFWVPIAYTLGISTWCVMETALYVLRGVQKVAMNVDPHTGYTSLSVLDDFALTSSYGMGVIFLFVMFLLISVAFLYSDSQVEWLITWIQTGLVGIYVAVALTLGGRIQSTLLILTVFIYLPVEIGLGVTRQPGYLVGFHPLLSAEVFGGRLRVYQYVSLALVGIFLTFIFMFHSRATVVCLRAIREKSRDFWIDFYKHQIDVLKEQLKIFSTSDINLNKMLLLQSLDSLISLQRVVSSSSVSPLSNVYQRVATIILLIITTFAPPLLEFIFMRVLSLPD